VGGGLWALGVFNRKKPAAEEPSIRVAPSTPTPGPGRPATVAANQGNPDPGTTAAQNLLELSDPEASLGTEDVQGVPTLMVSWSVKYRINQGEPVPGLWYTCKVEYSTGGVALQQLFASQLKAEGVFEQKTAVLKSPEKLKFQVFSGQFKAPSQPVSNVVSCAVKEPKAVGDRAPVSTAEWVEHRDTEGKYRLKFPQAPRSETRRVNGPVGGQIDVKFHTAEPAGELFQASFVTLPALAVEQNRPEARLDEAINRFEAEIKGSEANRHSITHQGFPAKETYVLRPDNKGMLILRVVVAGNRVISVAAGGDNSTTPESPRVRAFFDSLKIE
jgi:hypothetical protein